MNKELILKYEKEFNYWLHGGKLLGRFNFTNIKNYKPEPWFEFEETKWSLTSFEYLSIIIEDEYVELRKALAEGKTIEYSKLCLGIRGQWNKVTTILPGTDDKPSDYRIKPEEHQFKVGDWIRNSSSNTIFKYTNDMLKPDQSCCEFWKPKPGEWCWVSTDGTYSLYQYNSTSRSIHDLEPFIGTLPTHLQ